MCHIQTFNCCCCFHKGLDWRNNRLNYLRNCILATVFSWRYSTFLLFRDWSVDEIRLLTMNLISLWIWSACQSECFVTDIKVLDKEENNQLNSLHDGLFFMLLLSSADFFQNLLFQKNYFRKLSVSNSLDPEQDRQNVGPDLGPNCLQKGLTLCMMVNCTCFCCRLMTFFKINFFIKFFQEHYQSVQI